MKTKLLLTLLAFVLISGTCENDEPIVTDCDCRITYYLYTPNVGAPSGTYVEQFSEPIEFDCNNESYGNYFQVSNVNYNYAKIECE
jgi:hypothetical protein